MIAPNLRFSLAAALCAAAMPLTAQPIASVPAGAISYTIAAGTVSGPATTGLSVPLRDSVPQGAFSSVTNTGFTGAASGVVASIAAGAVSGQNVITVTNAGWDPLQFRVVAQPYFLRMLSGASAGRTALIVVGSSAHTSTSVVVDNQGFQITGSAGDRFEIFPADTLRTFFADLIAGGRIQTGANAAAADNVQITVNGSWVTFFHNGTTWRRVLPAGNGDDFVIRPEAGLLFIRRGTTPISFTALGVVPSSDLKVVIRDSGVTYLASLFPVDRPLSNLGVTPNAGLGLPGISGWVTASSPANADRVQVNTGSWVTYWNNGTEWRRQLPAGAANSVNIPAGRPVLLNRLGSASTTQVHTFKLPYSLTP